MTSSTNASREKTGDHHTKLRSEEVSSDSLNKRENASENLENGGNLFLLS